MILRHIVFATNKIKMAEAIAAEIIQTHWQSFDLPIEPFECEIRLLPYIIRSPDGYIIRPDIL